MPRSVTTCTKNHSWEITFTNLLLFLKKFEGILAKEGWLYTHIVGCLLLLIELKFATIIF